MTKQKQAFTLVELIVVITILAILGTIAFISLQGYSKNARDSTRISDLGLIKKVLELYHIKNGEYADPTTAFGVTYSGSIVWNQGIFGLDTLKNVGKLDKVPVDPLTNKEYTYSLTEEKQEYQLGGIMEISGISFQNQTFAGDKIATAIVTGNYNGQTIKAEKGTACEILSVPTIISSGDKTETDLTNILNDKKLVYNGYNNLPSNYNLSEYKTDGGFDFISNELIVYSDNNECKELYDNSNPVARINLVKNLQKAYSGTIIEDDENIAKVVNVDSENIKKLTVFGANLVNNNFGGNITKFTSDELICNEGEHSEDGLTCILDTKNTDTDNGTFKEIWDGNNWIPTIVTCDIDFYKDPLSETCISVGVGYYSNNIDITRTICTNHPDTASRDYTYTSDGDGGNNCLANYVAKCGVDLYEVGNSCSPVGIGNYSPAGNNGITACTNAKPDNSFYSNDGGGINNCSFSCNVGYSFNGNICILDIYPNAYRSTRNSCETTTITAGIHKIASCNVGATSTIPTSSNSYGKLFQFGNAAGYTSSQTPQRLQVNTSSCAPNNCLTNYIRPIDREPWYTTNNGLWGSDCPDISSPTIGCKIKSRGPCPLGFHIPTLAEFEDALSIIPVEFYSDFQNGILKMPPSGMIAWETGNRANNGVTTGYWTSTYGGKNAYYESAKVISVTTNDNKRANTISDVNYALPVRCFKN